jgi:hypothetical protein
MLPGEERIPVVDWTDPDQKRRIFVEAPPKKEIEGRRSVASRSTAALPS